MSSFNLTLTVSIRLLTEAPTLDGFDFVIEQGVEIIAIKLFAVSCLGGAHVAFSQLICGVLFFFFLGTALLTTQQQTAFYNGAVNVGFDSTKYFYHSNVLNGTFTGSLDIPYTIVSCKATPVPAPEGKTLLHMRPLMKQLISL